MRTRKPSLLTIVLLISSCALAQEMSVSGKMDSSHRSAKVLIVLGRVSADAHTLLTDLDSEWKISNANMLKGYEDRLVRVRCYVDTEKNQLRILTIKRDDGRSTYAVRYGDSAFRR